MARSPIRIRKTIPTDLTLKEWGFVSVVDRCGGVGSIAELSRITGADVRVLRRVLSDLREKGRVLDLEGGGFQVSFLRQR